MFPIVAKVGVGAFRFASRPALLLALVAAPAFAQGTGRSLDIQPGARQNGLGAAGAALFGDGSGGLWWNPALLGFVEQVSLQGTYARLVPGLAPDVDYDHAAGVVPVGRVGIGASYTHLDYGESFLGQRTERSPAIAVAVRILPELAVGVTAKRIRIELGPSDLATGETHGLDIGGAARFPLGRLTLGMGISFQNLGGEVEFPNEDRTYPLSENLKLGVSAEIETELSPGNTVSAVAVVDHNQSQITPDFDTWHGGMELSYRYRDLLAGAGRLGYYNDSLGDIRDFTFGFGVRAGFLSLDGAWIPQARDSGLERVVKITAGLHVDMPGRSK